MAGKRPRIEGYAVISREGMIATSDGRFPDEIKIPADHKFYQDSVAAAAAVANGRHSAEGGIGEKRRKRLILTRRVQRLLPHPENPKAILWNPATAPFEEAWARLAIDDGTLAVVGGTDVFGLFLTLGYDCFYLTRTDASVPTGRPVFPGVGTVTTAEEIMTKAGLMLRDTRMLDASVNCRVEAWVPKS
ncbi:MAG: dihydrofolate reductase [Alphaproteobacteria bacterium]|nr:dihydrofolate reductase [Alphaproteobacteria bacterium]